MPCRMRTNQVADMLLDATVFHDYRRGDAGARAIIEQIIEGEVKASISPLTVFDLWSGTGFDRQTEIAYTGLLKFLDEAPVTAEAARIAGIWVAPLYYDERLSFAQVALIAATAQIRDEPILTSHPELFERFYSNVIEY